MSPTGLQRTYLYLVLRTQARWLTTVPTPVLGDPTPLASEGIHTHVHIPTHKYTHWYNTSLNIVIMSFNIPLLI